MEALYETLAYARDLTLVEQRELLRLLTENIRHLERIECVRETGFEVGEKVIFTRQPKIEMEITVTGFSRDGMGIQGVGSDGTIFIVSATDCRKA